MDRSITDVLLVQYDSFTASERKIVDYVLAHQQESQYMSITELSAACGVAISTVSVFCRKLKLAGFNDFKLELARADLLTHPQSGEIGETEVLAGDSLETVLKKTLSRTQETLRRTACMLDEEAVERAVELLSGARQVMCLGHGNQAAVALSAWGQFATVSSKFKLMEDSHLQLIALSTLTREDVVLYFSYSGANWDLMDAVEVLRTTGAKLILVTRYAHSPAAEHADVVLLCGAEEQPLQYGSVDSTISQLYIIDVLISRYRLKNMDQVDRYREFIAKVLARKHL